MAYPPRICSQMNSCKCYSGIVFYWMIHLRLLWAISFQLLITHILLDTLLHWKMINLLKIILILCMLKAILVANWTHANATLELFSIEWSICLLRAISFQLHITHILLDALLHRKNKTTTSIPLNGIPYMITAFPICDNNI